MTQQPRDEDDEDVKENASRKWKFLCTAAKYPHVGVFMNLVLIIAILVICTVPLYAPTLLECPLCAADSTDRRNTIPF